MKEDLLYAFRVLFKRPGLTLLAILALSISVGMTTSAFSILNALFLKGPPFDDAHQLVAVLPVKYAEGSTRANIMPADFEYLKNQDDTYAGLIGYFVGTVNISGDQPPQRFDGAFISEDFLDVLRIEPAQGRSLRPAPARPEVLISWRVWQERYKGSTKILGTSIRANGMEREVVGILPEGFHFPWNADIWLPLSDSLTELPESGQMPLFVVGRLAPGLSRAEANQQLEAISAAHPGHRDPDLGGLRFTHARLDGVEWNQYSSTFFSLVMTAVGFVLLIACANVANLLLGRATARGRELAVRSALGASRARIMRQMLTESLVLATFGSIGGLVYASWTIDATFQVVDFDLPYWIKADLDWHVIAFVVAITLITAVLSGILPAWHASRTDINYLLKDATPLASGSRLKRFNKVLTVAQIAFSCSLLFAAGTTTRTVQELESIDPGFNPDRILTMRMGLNPTDYATESERDAFYQDLQSEVARIPGVEGAAFTSWIALRGNSKVPYYVDGLPPQAGNTPFTYLESVSPDYFRTMGTGVITGRSFLSDDVAGSSPVVIINEAMAREAFGNESPLGRIVGIPVFDKSQAGTAEVENFRVVGVVPNLRVSVFDQTEPEGGILYLPHTQSQSRFMTLMVRTSQEEPKDLLPAIQDRILRADPHLPVYFINTFSEYIRTQTQPFRVVSNLFILVGFMALFLAAVGVYGMISFGVSQQQREIGIRLALGARARNIIGIVLRQGVMQLTLGLGAGFFLAMLVGRLIRFILFGVRPYDTTLFAGVISILILVALTAYLVPAIRAARLSPMEALRYE